MSRVGIIAEIGVNHNGSLDLARQLVRAAADAGADFAKFQSFRAGELVTRAAPKADYQRQTTGTEESQFDMLSRLSLGPDEHRELMAECKKCGIGFLSTPFDHPSLALLCDELGLRRLKVSSGDLTNAPLLLDIARRGCEVLLSTGMSTLGEIEEALGVLAFGFATPEAAPSRAAFRQAYRSAEGQALLRQRVTLMHCTTEYPAPVEEVNLRCIATLRAAFDLPTGFSDHTEGISIAIAAAALGATVIEKHFTLDRNLSGPDHRASLEPAEFMEMAAGIREVETALGSGIKAPTQRELRNIAVARKSLAVIKPIRAGEPFSAENLGARRPGTGIDPIAYWEWLGKTASKDHKVDELL